MYAALWGFGTADTVLVREVSLIRSVLYREVPLYWHWHIQYCESASEHYPPSIVFICACLMDTSGADSVKMQDFFDSLDWHNLLKTKAELFVPELQGEEDTSYFDSELVSGQMHTLVHTHEHKHTYMCVYTYVQ